MTIDFIYPKKLDVRAWSGTPYHIFKELEKNNSVNIIDELESFPLKASSFAFKKLSKVLLNKNVLHDRENWYLNSIAKSAKANLNDKSSIIFSTGSIPIANLEVENNIIFWTDASFAGMLDYYPAFTGLSKRTIRLGHEMEQRALDKASYAIYSSEWAAKSVLDNYNVNPNKVKVIPFGSNFTSFLPDDELITTCEARIQDEVHLLFVGVDWERKGGDLALGVVEKLRQNKINAFLHIVGCNCPVTKTYIIEYGYLSKNNPNDLQKLINLYYKSTYLIVPSRYECFGIVFAEASSFALPSISTITGGIPSAVSNNKNGFTFSLDSFIEEASKKIIELYKNPSEYIALQKRAYAHYMETLNWESAVRKLAKLTDSSRD